VFATLLANLGLAVQEVAQGWIVLDLTGSAVWLGVVAAFGRVPFIIVAPIGGVFADRYNRRMMLGTSTVVRMLPAIALANIVPLGLARPWHFALAAVLLGLGHAFAVPTNQALVRELVPKPDIPSAVAMQVGQLQLARALGPLLASAVFAVASVSSGFYVTAICCVPLVLFCVPGFRSPAPDPAKKLRAPVFTALRQGLEMAREDRKLATLLVGSAVTALLLMSYPALFPLIAKQLGAGAAGNAYLGGASGLGAFIGALVMPSLVAKRNWVHVLAGAGGLAAASLLALAWAPDLVTACALTLVTSAASTTYLTATNSTLQWTTPPEFAGRILALNLVSTSIGMMLGSLLIGLLAERSMSLAFATFGAASAAYALVLASKAQMGVAASRGA
jgi:MFS family permease